MIQIILYYKKYTELNWNILMDYAGKDLIVAQQTTT